MASNADLVLLKTNLQAAMPTRLVTRSATDFAQRPTADRRRGVVTVVSTAINDLKNVDAFFEVAGKLRIALLAEFELSEHANGEEVEAAEWALLEEVREFIRAPGAGLCPLDALSVEFSAQALVPTGWLFVILEFAEID